MTPIRHCVCVALALSTFAPFDRGRAEDYPAGGITAVVALAAGGSMDVCSSA